MLNILLPLKRICRNNKTILANSSYLSILQLFSLLFPFITYPYVLRIVGIEKYGIIVFASSIVTYISLFVNFGFNTIGVRDIALDIDNPEKRNQIVSAIYINKFIIWSIFFIAYVLVITFLHLRKDIYLIYLFSFFLTFNDLLFPAWFFQAIEKMRYITIINISIRILFVFTIFIIVKQASDYVWLPLLNSIGALIGGIVALYIVFVKEKVKFKIQEKNILIASFKSAFPVFLASFSVQLYLYVNKIFVGAFLGMSEVTIYDLGEKISSLLRLPVGIISQATFPKFSRDKNVSYINKVMKANVLFVLCIYVAIFLISKWVVIFFIGKQIYEAEITTRILAFAAVFATLNVYLGGNRMIPLGYEKLYSKISMFACLFFLSYLFLIYHFNAISYLSIALNILITEFVVCLTCLYFDCKLKILKK